MMEPLGLSEHPPGHGGGAPAGSVGPSVLGQPPHPPQQLPVQMFTTAASLLDLTDKKLMVMLRDGRKLLGVLRSWDQYANLVLQSTVERILVPPESVPSNHPSAQENRGIYADYQRGMFLVRGENVILLGEIDLDKDDDPPPGCDKGDPELVEKLAKNRKAEDRIQDKEKQKKLSRIGFEGDSMGDVLLI